jgi:ABC-type transport system involved in multi-copper enzyme maturation permease subunit
MVTYDPNVFHPNLLQNFRRSNVVRICNTDDLLEVRILAGEFSEALMGATLLGIAFISGFLGGFSIANDFTHNTSTFVLALPVRRRTIYLGRYLCALTLGGVLIGVYYAYVASVTFYNYASIPLSLIASFALSIIFVGSALAIAFMLSALLKSERTTSFATIITLFLVLPIGQGVLELRNIDPIGILTYAGFAAFRVISTKATVSFQINIVNLAPNYPINPGILEGTLVMIAYLVAALSIGLFSYTKSEI